MGASRPLRTSLLPQNTSPLQRAKLSNRLEALDLEDDVEDLPRLTLVEALSYDLEPVVPERGVFRLDGELRRCEPGTELHDLVRETADEAGGSA